MIHKYHKPSGGVMVKKSFANFWAIVVFVFVLAAAPMRIATAQDSVPPVPQVIDSIELGIQPVAVRLNPVTSSFYQAPPPPRSGGSGLPRARLSATFFIDYVANGGTNVFS